MKVTNGGCQYCCNNTSADQSKDVLFYYSLFIQIMYIIVNKATFIVIDIPNPYIKTSIKTINTTSLSHSNNYVVKWQHICLSHFLKNLYHIFYKITSTDIKIF